jgi:hypothetical protein
MNHQGHGVARQHAIFNTPNRVTFPTTVGHRGRHHEGYTSPLYPNGMGETYELVDFEEGPPDGWNPTIVSHEGFFTDVPGLESLVEGESSKMLGSLALARQGRYFYWGYSIDPERLTAPAEDTLENVLRYMVTKRDARTTPFVCDTRRSLWVYLALFRESGYKRGIEEHFLGMVQPESRVDYVATAEGLETWLAANLDYVFSGKGDGHRSERYGQVYEVDMDAKALGTPNAARASLERWLQLATSADEAERTRATRLLQRYVHPDVAPKSWSEPQTWYTEWRDRIVFVESAGFWWLEDPTRAH